MEKNTIINILIVVLFILVVYMLLTRIFGHSATDLAIMTGLFVLLFVNQYKVNREIGEMRINMKNSFDKIKADMSLIKKDIKQFKK